MEEEEREGGKGEQGEFAQRTKEQAKGGQREQR